MLNVTRKGVSKTGQVSLKGSVGTSLERLEKRRRKAITDTGIGLIIRKGEVNLDALSRKAAASIQERAT